MIVDAKTLPAGTSLESDVCIAGGGAAGITIATDLIGQGLDVVLLEAGPLDQDDGPAPGEPGSAIYEGQTSGLPVDLSDDRVRAFGGTTNHWGGWCMPLEPADFADGGYPAGSDWPIEYAEMVPYYRRAHETCDLGAFEYDAETIRQREGASTLDVDETEVRHVMYQRGPPTRFGEKYGAALRNAGNVTVYTRGNLVEIVPERGGGRVERFACDTIDGPSFEVEADRYVLAMGGIENPRLLLASTSRSSRGVGNDNGLVGRYFMQHPHFNAEAYALLDGFDDAFYNWHTAETRDEHGEFVETDLRGVLALEADRRREDHLPNVACTLVRIDEDRTLSSVSRDEVASLPDFLPDETALSLVVLRAEQRPLEASRVTLTNETDVLGIPRADVDWRIAERDVEAYGECLRRIGTALSTQGLGRIWTRTDEDDRFTFQDVWGGAHHMGTTRMAERPENGVVDSACRFHEVRNLYAAGSSVFPTGGYANPTLTIVALAHRLADHLQGELT